MIARRHPSLSELWREYEEHPPDPLDGSPFTWTYPRIGRDAALATLDGLASMDGRYLVYDCETTGVARGAGGSEVIEIGVCTADGTPVFHSVVRPVMLSDYAGSEAERQNGIPAHVLARPRMLTLAVMLTGAPVVVAWNAPFDAEMLARSLRRHGIVTPRLRWCCAVCAGNVSEPGEPRIELVSAVMSLRPPGSFKVYDGVRPSKPRTTAGGDQALVRSAAARLGW